ncbi:MAG: redoxin domain-containing protein [Bacillaceae bacterium]|nr:redoxin domain-containing protein [Bacillaceae bacterium]
MRLHTEMPELSGAVAWLNGEVTKQQLIGNKPTLIHFWSISCRLCKSGLESVNQFRDRYKDQLNVIAVHMPRSEKDLDLEEIKKQAEHHKIYHPIYIDNQHILTDAFENKYVPAYYVFDHEGVLRHYQAGSGGIKMLTKRIHRVLGIADE